MRVATCWTLALSCIVTLALALPARAADDAKPDAKPGDRPNRPNREEMMKKFDTNGDGKLDESEKQAAREAWEKRRAEKGAAGDRGPKGPNGEGSREERRAAFMKKFDANGDGQLDDTEKQAAHEEMMKLRGNGGPDGPNAKGGPGGPDRQKMREEFMKKFDTNGDGKLDESEKEAAHAEMKAKGGPGGPGGPGGNRPSGNRRPRSDKQPGGNTPPPSNSN